MRSNPMKRNMLLQQQFPAIREKDTVVTKEKPEKLLRILCQGIPNELFWCCNRKQINGSVSHMQCT